jgi:hypothetical protein
MAPLHRAWRRWRRFAHRAAVVQSHVLLFILYVLVVVPAGAVMSLFGGGPRHDRGGWRAAENPTNDFPSARRQF